MTRILQIKISLSRRVWREWNSFGLYADCDICVNINWCHVAMMGKRMYMILVCEYKWKVLPSDISRVSFDETLRFLHRYSIDTPSYSIETMDLLWSWYGVTMEYLRWNSEELASVNEENDDSLAFALFAWNCIFNFMCLAVLQSFLCKNGAWIVKIDIFRSFFQVFLWSFGKNQYLYTQFPQCYLFRDILHLH